MSQAPRSRVTKPAPQADPVVLLCRAHGLPDPMLEYAFAPGRKFRADYAWPTSGVTLSGAGYVNFAVTWYSPYGGGLPRPVFAGAILEVQGGIWRSKGAHNTGTALLRDFEKSNLAQTLGFLYLQCTPQQVQSGAVLTWLKQVL